MIGMVDRSCMEAVSSFSGTVSVHELSLKGKPLLSVTYVNNNHIVIRERNLGSYAHRYGPLF